LDVVGEQHHAEPQGPNLATSAYPSPIRAGYCVALLVLACLLAFIDIQVFALIVPPVKAGLNISDTRIGVLQGPGLNLVAGLFSMPLGLLIDRSNRMRLVVLSVIGWSLFSILSGFCGDFWQLLTCRVGVGLAEAGLYPAAYSVIADLYPPHRRSHATLTFFGGILVTGSMAIAISGTSIGYINRDAHDLLWDVAGRVPWRLSFIAAGLPGLLLAGMFIWAKEPTRKYDATTQAPVPGSRAMLDFLRAHWLTVMRFSAGSSLCAAALNAMFFWLPTLANRQYGMSEERSGQLFGLTFGIGSVSGTVAAALLDRWLRRRGGALAPLDVLQLGLWAITLCFPVLFLAANATWLFGVWMVFSAATYVSSSITPVLWLNITPNQLRGRVNALSNLVDQLIQMAVLPLVGALSDTVFRDPGGLLKACGVVGAPCLLTALMLLARVRRPMLRMVQPERADPDAAAVVPVLPLIEA
jgi:MFS family permease